MSVKDYVEYRMKEKILERKKELEKQMTDLVNNINKEEMQLETWSQVLDKFKGNTTV